VCYRKTQRGGFRPAYPKRERFVFQTTPSCSPKNSTMTLRHKSVAKFLGPEPGRMLLRRHSRMQGFSRK
jgi:hypothetical protein